MSNTQRLYFLLPGEESASKVTEDLRSIGIKDENIHVVAGDEGTVPSDVPEASVPEESDVKGAALKGAATGAGTGFFAGLAAITLAPGIVLAGGAVLAAGAVGGAALGTWISTMIGVSVPNPDVKPFLDALDEGKLLMFVDFDNETRADKIKNLVLQHEPEAIIQAGKID